VPYIRFTSHRARSSALEILTDAGYGRPQGYWSLKRSTHPGGVYQLTEAQVALIKGAHLVHFTQIRGPYHDLLLCVGA
jgi:hypothetical protein